jgi:hypothetical protein
MGLFEIKMPYMLTVDFLSLCAEIRCRIHS